MDINTLETAIKNIKFDDYYIEATFQFKLLVELASLYDKEIIFPERNIKYYGLSNLTGKEIDIVLECDNNIALELKMPMNGKVPEEMYAFIEDIKFLEEIKLKFHECYFITVTNDQLFWEGREKNGIYSYFRNNNEIHGEIYKPTGKNKNKECYEITGKYNVEWKELNDKFKYFIIKI
jgi:hypothetical protein